MPDHYHALALFSGGLDSILAARLIQDQGLRVKCLHFISPFYGKPERIAHWSGEYGLDIAAVDAAAEASALVARTPANGFGKFLNPCVDCKIMMLSKAKELLPAYGASFIISGEVVGQRPMSQRRDAMNLISRRAGVRDILLRPLCARNLDPTPMEEGGLVDRLRLGRAGGRGRKVQLALAGEMGITDIPTPAGGCRLAEAEAAKRYFAMIKAAGEGNLAAEDFALANLGRQYWAGGRLLAMGRRQADNARLAAMARPRDLVLDLAGFPGPLGLGRAYGGGGFDAGAVGDAAAFLASFSPKAVRAGGEVEVLATRAGETETLTVRPSRTTPTCWREPDIQALRDFRKAQNKASG